MATLVGGEGSSAGTVALGAADWLDAALALALLGAARADGFVAGPIGFCDSIAGRQLDVVTRNTNAACAARLSRGFGKGIGAQGPCPAPQKGQCAWREST
jgi:hypothetical protein